MRARAPLYVWHLQAAALPGHRGTAAALVSTQHDPRNDIASTLRRFHTVDRGHNRGYSYLPHVPVGVLLRLT